MSKPKEFETTQLGKIDYEKTTPYDLAVVLVDYIRTSSFGVGAVVSVGAALTRWHTAQMTLVQPNLVAARERYKEDLTALKSKIDWALLQLERERYAAPKDSEDGSGTTPKKDA